MLRIDGHVLKAYGNASRYESALAGARGAPAAVPTARFELALRDLQLIVQSAVDGAPPRDAVGSAARAGELLRQLHSARADGLEVARPERELAIARHHADLAATVVPALGPRLEVLLERLADRLPQTRAVVPAHGDFRVDRCLVAGDDVWLIGFDGMCLAPPALDVGSYAADVVGGGGDGEALAAVLEPLVEGYGGRPEALEWYVATAILKRATDPFGRLVPEWPARVEAAVRAAEGALRA